MTPIIDGKKLMEMKLMADIEALIHAFMHAEIEQFSRASQGMPRAVSYTTLRSAVASDVIHAVRKHDHERRS